MNDRITGTAERLIRVALGAFPREFRERFGDDALLYFRDRANAVRQRGGRTAVWVLVARTVINLVGTGLVQRVRGRSFRPALPDVRYAMRSLRRRPAFVIATAAPVALGIAAVVAVLAVVETLLLSPLPYPDPERLVVLGRPLENGILAPVSAANVLDLEGSLSALDLVGAVQGGGVVVQGGDHPEIVQISRPTAQVFEILGMRTAFGRLPAADEPHAVVVTHDYAARRWGDAREAVGAALSTDWNGGAVLSVVGVLTPAFEPPEALEHNSAGEIWFPLSPTEEHVEITRAFGFARGIARLAPGRSAAAANGELAAAAERLAGLHPKANRESDGTAKRLAVRSLRAQTLGDFGTRLILLLGAVGALLVIVCANVANLFLASGMERERELALRGVLGASRSRVAVQLLTEAGIVGLIGGAVGTGLAFLSVDTFVALTPDLPRAAEIEVDVRTIAAAAMISLASALAFGLAPLGLVIRRESAEILSGRARRHGAERLRGALVVGQIALACVLVTGGGLLVNSAARLAQTDRGFDPRHVVFVRPRSTDAPKEERGRFMRELVDVAAGVPGVEAVSGSLFVPGLGLPVTVHVAPTQSPGPTIPLQRHSVLPDFFGTLGIPVLEGRSIGWQDTPQSEGVAVVSAAFARRLWGGASPLGRTFEVRERQGGDVIRRHVVGIAADIRNRSARHAVEPVFWESYFQNPWLPGVALLVKARPGFDVVGSLRDAISVSHPSVALSETQFLAAALAEQNDEERAYAILLTLFSALALGIAAVGIYATLSYSITRRFAEIALRRAVGAASRDVLTLVLRRGIGQTVAGLALGLGTAAFATRLVSDLLFEVTPRDPTTYAVVVGTLLLVSLAACAAPAHRAIRVAPSTVLRADG